MKKNIGELFNRNSKGEIKPLFILEMANNHMGDVKHGFTILRKFHKIAIKFDFNFAFKLQYRDIPTFIHPDFKNRQDLKYVKRFAETKLKDSESLALKNEMDKLGFTSICTPFDEPSVELIVKHGYDIIKIGSCSFGDWPLLEKIAQYDKPIIASTAGATLEQIDAVVTFLQNRNKQFALMHCVGEYPTPDEDLQLNQIDLLRERYPEVVIGFSTHEEPDNFKPVQLALAKGATVFERHVAVNTKKYEINAYSSTPEQADQWLSAAKKAIDICGVNGQRASFSNKEMADLRQFKRGVFAGKKIGKGQLITIGDVFYAFPNKDSQLVANDLSKYIHYYATKNYAMNQAIDDVQTVNVRKDIHTIVSKVNSLLKKAKVTMPKKVDVEISHHYGLEKFYEVGATLVNCINREYCKKLIIMLPNQLHPVQYHKEKEETFHVLYGELEVTLDGKTQVCKPGDILTVERAVRHSFVAPKGGVIEEISSTHYKSDSYYEDEQIMKNKNRKTYLSYWIE